MDFVHEVHHQFPFLFFLNIYLDQTDGLRVRSPFLMKERVRFELTEPVSSSDFKSDAIDHSAISPDGSEYNCQLAIVFL